MTEKAATCTYRFVHPDGYVETCRAPDACEICHQCSRIEDDREHGHCCTHLGLLDSIPVPGQDVDRERTRMQTEQEKLRKQKRVREHGKADGQRRKQRRAAQRPEKRA